MFNQFHQMPNNGNPFSLVMNALKNGGNPQALVMQMFKAQGNNNPFFSNLVNLGNSNNGQAIEQIVRNACKEKGLDFDKEFEKFRKQFNL